jgi:hypothetical protein
METAMSKLTKAQLELVKSLTPEQLASAGLAPVTPPMTQAEAIAALQGSGNPYYRFDSVETGETLAVGTLFHMKRAQDKDQRATLEGMGAGILANTVQVGMDVPVTCTVCVSHGSEEEGTLGEAKTIGGVAVTPVYRKSKYTRANSAPSADTAQTFTPVP